ncbi:NAD(P)/FAD-dependent oxidoreductase [Hutsoniella sourekii]|uniref:NAD(P)/FAD-dependent oxidoreductase n=1 Tax=Hutsoniella sourekii TaxID=87650 RepID=UPI00047F8083|nr:FAD-dependent oxidoreductase [Hutsoniella sourekii]
MKQYDLVIIGAGPAGMTAAIYGVRANLSVLLLDKLAPGGQIINTNEIENYPGVGKLNGAELAFNMFEHAQSLGVEFDYLTVNQVEDQGDVKLIHTEEQEEAIQATTVIVATGTRSRTLNIPGEEEFKGSDISWCAICDGAKYRGKDVVVIGGGNSAVDEGTYLATIVNSLTIVTDFDLTADPVSCEYLRNLDNVTVYPYKRVTEFVGENGSLAGVKFVDKETGENETVVKADGVFEYIGAVPSTECIQDLGITESHGFIETNERMETSIPGIYGAGDCNSKHLRQVVTATSDGAIAAQQASAYIKELRRNNN